MAATIRTWEGGRFPIHAQPQPLRVAVCSVCRQPDPEGAHRHACE